MGKCVGCGADNPPGARNCRICDHVLGTAAPARSRSRLKLVVLGGLLGVAVGLWRLSPLSRNPEADCQGGATAEVVWKSEDASAPRLELPNVNQIDPRVTRFVELARLRSTGTRRYGQNNDRELRHLHQGVVDGLHAAGANGYFHQPSKPVGQDLSETITTAVLAHPGPIKRALRDRYFAGGRAAMIFQLGPGGAAEKAGMRVNDLVVSFAGQPIEGALPTETLLRMSGGVGPDGEAEIVVVRDNQVQALKLRRQGAEKFWYWAQTVPIIEVVD
jgi:hypothetical protein